MSEVIELTCIGCPMGCQIQAKLENGEVVDVKGNTCKRGQIYAQKECTNPTRIITSSVEVESGEINVLSVKTEKDVPKDKLFDCVQSLRGVRVKAPVRMGDIIIRNIANTGVNIIASKSVRAKQ